MLAPARAMNIKVKICGITSSADASEAVEAGADALGFVFFERSPRHVTPDQAAKIIRSLPPFVAKVGVFVDADEARVRATAAQCGLDTLQFHGDESPEYCARFAPLKVIRAFRIRDKESISGIEHFTTDAWLLDSHVAGKQGGTGSTFNWDLAATVREAGRPVILAGGLNAENIAEAIHQVWPYAVDVSSGVESAPGVKSPALIRQFIASVRGVEVEKL
jgi:phosphoribosylanthranilate isomerase